MMTKTGRLLLGALAFVGLAGCRWVQVAQYELKTQVVEYPDRRESPRSWPISDEILPLDTELLEEAGFHSALVLKRSELIFEWYAKGYGTDSVFNMKSVSKSLLSAIVGIAASEGKLHLNDAIPRVGPCEVPPGLQPLTPRHLLTMSAGFRFVENANLDVYAGDSWSCKILQLPLEAENGVRFNYGTVQSYLLGMHLEERVGVPLEKYFEEKLFTPMGIALRGWRIGPESVPFSGSEMRLTARDVLAFGQLYLQRGQYQGKEIVPEAWVEKSFEVVWPEAVENQGHEGHRYGYGYGQHWWKTTIADREFLAALGFGGQTLFISRDLELVLVTTAPIDHHDQRMGAARRLVAAVVDGVEGAGA